MRFDKYFKNDSVMTFEVGTANISGPVFQTGIGRVNTDEAERPFARFAYSRPHLNVIGYYSGRNGDQTSLQSAESIITESRKYSIEAQTYWDLGGEDRGRFVFGGAFVREEIDTADTSGVQTLLSGEQNIDRNAVFSQFDWKFNETVKVVLAGRFDQSPLHEDRFSPKAAFVFGINPNHKIRTTYSVAFQVANYSEFFLDTIVTRQDLGFVQDLCVSFGVDCGLDEVPVLAVGNEDLDVEETLGYEIGYSGIIAGKAFITLDYYRNDNKDFITDLLPQRCSGIGGECQLTVQPIDRGDPLNPNIAPWVPSEELTNTQVPGGQTLADLIGGFLNGPIVAFLGAEATNAADGSTILVARTYTNFGEVETQGVDFGLNYFFDNGFNFQANYSWFDFELSESNETLQGLLLPNTPEHKASLGLTYTGSNWTAGISGRWVDEFLWNAGLFAGLVESYTTVDLNAGYDINENWSFGINISNVLDENSFQAFGGDILARRALTNATYRW